MHFIYFIILLVWDNFTRLSLICADLYERVTTLLNIDSKRLQSADHICKALQKKRWSKRLQSAAKKLVWSYLVKSEVVGSREQWKSAVDGRNRRSQLGIGGRSSESAVAGLETGGLRRGCRWAVLRRRRRVMIRWKEAAMEAEGSSDGAGAVLEVDGAGAGASPEVAGLGGMRRIRSSKRNRQCDSNVFLGKKSFAALRSELPMSSWCRGRADLFSSADF
ncbi:hypothetical protein LXL04_011119 [Taraxacum kok-saghyz]